MIVLLQQPRQIGHALKSWTGAKAAHVCSCVGFTKLSVLHRSVHFGSASTEKLAVMVIRKDLGRHLELVEPIGGFVDNVGSLLTKHTDG